MSEPFGQAGAEPAPLKHLSLLVLDEHEVSRRTLGLILEAAGASVTCADTLSEALEHLSVRHFDAVLTDIRMPGATVRGGRVVLGSASGANAFAPVITIGSLTPGGLPAPIRAAGMVVEMGRPLDPAHICEELRTLRPRAAG